jgi:CDP-diglyceride synthetase
VGTLLVAGAIATLLVGRLALSIFTGVVLLAAYVDLRRLLADPGHPVTLILGGGGVVGALWCGYNGRLSLLPAVAAALVLALLVSRIVLHEAGIATADVTADLSATLGAAGLVGILGAHVLLIRAVPRFGFRGIVAFMAIAVANEATSFVVGKLRGRRALHHQLAPQQTWEGALGGFVASVIAGLVIGLAIDPPFGISSGLLFGLAVGIAIPLGDLGIGAIKRSAGVKRSGAYLGAAGGALDAVNGVLFAAPVFYWAFRTVAL